jgi:hypothetical protein
VHELGSLFFVVPDEGLETLAQQEQLLHEVDQVPQVLIRGADADSVVFQGEQLQEVQRVGDQQVGSYQLLLALVGRAGAGV